MCGIVSQSDVVRFLSKHIKEGKLKDIGARTLVSLGYAQHNNEIVTVDERKNVLTALHTLDARQVSAVAIVDSRHRLSGNFRCDARGVCGRCPLLTRRPAQRFGPPRPLPREVPRLPRQHQDVP